MKTLEEILQDLENVTPKSGGEGGEAPETPPQVDTCFNDFTPFENTDPLPEFPYIELYCAVPAVADFIYAAAEAIQAPIDLVGVCTLGVLEIACRGRYAVQFPNGHTERACLYIAPIAPPSERKSGVIETVTRPLREYEESYNKEHGTSESEIKMLQAKIAKAERDAVNGKTPDERLRAEAEFTDLSAKLIEAEKKLRLFGADVTPEKLADIIKSQDGVFALLSAEGGGLFENIGRYSDKGGLEIYLNGYSGDRICVDRKSSESIVVECPTLSLLAPCQPSVISKLFSDTEKSGRGLLSRILFTQCKSRVGERKSTSKPISDYVYGNYEKLCLDILGSEGKGDLRFDEGGFAVYSAFFDEIEARLTPDIGELSFMADWAGKLHGNMARFAGLIHCTAAFSESRDPLRSPINAEEATAAVTLSRYFLAHAKSVYLGQAEPKWVSNAKYLWERLKSLKSTKISKRDLTRSVQRKTDFDYSDSLQTLINRGYILIETIIQDKGRPIENIIINPEAVKKG